MSGSDAYEVLAWSEEGYNRSELRLHPNGDYQAVRLRAAVDGGWYVREQITVPSAPAPAVEQ